MNITRFAIEKNRITRVKHAENIPRKALPNKATADAPATNAPIVLAMVLSVRIAVIGLVISFFNSFNKIPDFLPDFDSNSM